MKEAFQKIFKAIYKTVIRRIVFSFDAETAHDKAIALAKFLSRYDFLKKSVSFVFGYKNRMLEQKILGIKFENPIGLAAGFDKNAELTRISGPLGFGFEEVGSITAEPCQGNPKPRLWRLIKSKGFIVWYGLKNNGVEEIAERLRNLTSRQAADIPIGTNIARTNSAETVSLKDGVSDYTKSFKILADIGDYFVVNISCPNAHGGKYFCDTISLEILLSELDKIKTKKPVFVKIPPDISFEETDEIINSCKNHRVHGFVISNLTKDPARLEVDQEEFEKINQDKGGISGKPVKELSNKLIKYVYEKTQGRFIIIGCGGVFSAQDAYEKIRFGASLVELITGMVFEGPEIIGEINRGLVKLMKKDGFKNISEAIGIDAKKI